MRFLKRCLFKYCFIFIFFSFSSGKLCADFVTDFQAVNAYAAVTCLEEAMRIYNEGDLKQAFFHAQLGQSYAPDTADFPYLQALCGKSIGVPLEDCLNNAESCLSAGMRWLRYDEQDAKLLCAEINLKMLNYNEALNLISEIEFPNAGSDFVKAASLYGLNRIREAESLISASLDKYGFQPRIVKLFFLQERNIKQDTFGKNLAKKILSVLYLWKNDYAELLPLACPFEPNNTVNVRNLKMHRVMHLPFVKTHDTENAFFYADAVLMNLHYGVISGETAVEEFFSLKVNLDEPVSGEKVLVPLVFKKHIVKLCSMIGNPSLRSRIKETLKTYSGAVAEDSNKDGIPESIIFYKNGRPFSASFDPSQGGYPRFTVECNFGIPKKVIAKKNSYTAFFDEYPFLSSVEKGGVSYTIRPLSLKWQPVILQELNLMLFSKKEKSQAFFILSLKSGVGELTEQNLIYSSLYSEKDDTENNQTEKIFFNKGIPVSHEKRFKGILISVLSYKNGIPSVEKADLNADGYFELIRKFDENGVLTSISVDLNKDNVFEYNEFYPQDGSVKKIWSSESGFEILYAEFPSGNSLTEWVHPVSKEKISVKYSSGIPRILSVGKKNIQILKDGKSPVYWLKKLPDISEKLSSEILKDFNRTALPLVSIMLETVNGQVFAVKSGGVVFAEFLDE